MRLLLALFDQPVKQLATASELRMFDAAAVRLLQGHMKNGAIDCGKASCRISRLLLSPSSSSHTCGRAREREGVGQCSQACVPPSAHTWLHSSTPSSLTSSAKPAVLPPTPK